MDINIYVKNNTDSTLKPIFISTFISTSVRVLELFPNKSSKGTYRKESLNAGKLSHFFHLYTTNNKFLD